MKKNKFVLVSLLFSLNVIANPVTEKDILVKMKEQYVKALSGSGSAAMEISQALAEKILPQKNGIQPFEEWQRIAAENGYKNAQHAYAQTLWSKRKASKYYSIRARYWAERAAIQGFAPATELLKIFDNEERLNSK